ncbi:MAG: cobalamin-dependent protein [Bacteroidota bacterium]
MQKTVLSTAEVARLFNVTETTVKRWADEGTLKCQKTPGGHRKFQMRYLVEFATTRNFEPLGALTLEGGGVLARKIEVAVLSRNFNELRAAFIEKALSPDRRDLYEFFSYLYQHHVHQWEIFDLVLGPGMREIGERWERREIGVDHEHRAFYETLDAMAKLQSQVLTKAPAGHTVICACLDDELHEMGLRCASYIFAAEGWHVQYLGARTPHDSLIASIREQRTHLVCISATTIGDESSYLHALEKIRAAAHERETRVLLGGRAVTPALTKACDAVYRSSKDLMDVIQHYPQSVE